MKGYIEIEVPRRMSVLTGFGGYIECDIEGVKFFANTNMAHDLARAKRFWRDNGIEVSRIARPEWASEEFAYGSLESDGTFRLYGCETSCVQIGVAQRHVAMFDLAEKDKAEPKRSSTWLERLKKFLMLWI